MRLLVLLALVIVGALGGGILMAGLALMSGQSVSDMLKGSDSNMSDWMVRITLLLNHLTMFIIPAILWAFIYYNKKWMKALDLVPGSKWSFIGMGILLLIVAYPIVAISAEMNASLHLPDWMHDMEGQTEVIMKKILHMDSIGSLLMNVLIIGIIPGIGEELIFRGIIQKSLYKYVANPYVAILLASILFSALHFQFEGFLPRVILGMILGLIYFWSGSLWPNIAAHAFNNGIQVVMTYFNPKMIDSSPEDMHVEWYVLLGSLALSFLVGIWFYNKKKEQDTPTPSIATIEMDGFKTNETDHDE